MQVAQSALASAPAARSAHAALRLRPRRSAVVCAAAKPRRDAQGRELEEKVREEPRS